MKIGVPGCLEDSVGVTGGVLVVVFFEEVWQLLKDWAENIVAGSKYLR